MNNYMNKYIYINILTNKRPFKEKSDPSPPQKKKEKSAFLETRKRRGDNVFILYSANAPVQFLPPHMVPRAQSCT